MAVKVGKGTKKKETLVPRLKSYFFFLLTFIVLKTPVLVIIMLLCLPSSPCCTIRQVVHRDQQTKRTLEFFFQPLVDQGTEQKGEP